MKDKIARLAKGITDIEAPVIRIIPESFSDTIFGDRDNSVIIELQSTNGIGMKGICFTDDPRLRPDLRTFVGRRVHVSLRVDTAALRDGAVLAGCISFVTNGGELEVPYRFVCRRAAGSTDGSGSRAGVPGPFDPDVEDSPLRQNSAGFGTGHAESAPVSAQAELLAKYLPEDEPLFNAMLAALIRADEHSPYAFSVYREAVRRGINITRLYESYVYAFPEDSDEPMPREVLLYFSYGFDSDQAIRRKIYKNIIAHPDTDPALYTHYEGEISHYAVSRALDRYIDDDLAALYDKMIYPGMIDTKAAAVFPDLFKCRRFRTAPGAADLLVVSYPEIRGGLRADLSSGTAYVPVYFDNAEVRLYKGTADPEDVTDTVQYSAGEVFSRPDIVRRCFELCPGHRMLLLSAAKEIAARGIENGEEKEVLIRALTVLELRPEFRNRVIFRLCEYGGDTGWMNQLGREDFRSEAGSRLFGLLVRSGRLPLAWELLKYCGVENVSPEDAASLASDLISRGSIPSEDGQISPDFIGLCKRIFDEGLADPDILRLLAHEYEGSSEEMFRVLQAAQDSGTEVYDLPEKILTVKLFSGHSAHLDEVFEAYISRCAYTDVLLRAYFSFRCSESFLQEEIPAEGVLFEALNSYAKAVEDPLSLPVIYQLELTRCYSEQEKLDHRELELCQRMTDYLVSQGLVFCYTKKLRKKIRISDEIFRRFYVEYRASSDAPPKMLSRVLPDEEEYHVTDMRRVYRNIYVMSTILFKGDELQYVIYDNAFETEAGAEGIISVRKYHKQNDRLFEELNLMTRALEEKDIDQLRENMLEYAENAGTIKMLFSLEK